MLLITPDATNMYFDNDRLIDLITALRNIGQDSDLHGLILAIYSGVEEYYLSPRELTALFKAMFIEGMGGMDDE